MTTWADAVGASAAVGLEELGGQGGKSVAAVPGLLDWIPMVSPEFARPGHMGEVAEVFERALGACLGSGEVVRELLSWPIRHWKTETYMHGVLWLMMQIPDLRCIFLTHSDERAKHVGKRVREIADRTAVGPTRGFNEIKNWQNAAGGGIVVMSAEQSKEGHDCHLLIADDPIDEIGSQVADVRETVDRALNYYTARCMRKGKPGPVLVTMSRQHPDDPIGRRLVRKAVKWHNLHNPAIIDLGLPTERAFAPEVWSLEQLKAIRAEQKESDPYERVFWSRFQGEPRTEGATFYGEPARYATLPAWPGFRDAIGIDMSHTDGKSSDWFACCLVRFYGGQAFIVNAFRFKPDPREVPGVLRGLLAESAGGTCPIFSYVSGPEVGMLGRFAVDHGINVQGMPARVNKLWRTQRTIKKWNDGGIMVPADAPWAPTFIKRMKGFTGLDGDEDDESDALVSVCDAMLGLVGQAGPGTVGTRRI